MEIKILLDDAYQEYPDKVMCRRHWNFKWRGRRVTKQDDDCQVVRSRVEEFGGIIQTKSGQILMLDHEAFRNFVCGNIMFEQDTSGGLIWKNI